MLAMLIIAIFMKNLSAPENYESAKIRNEMKKKLSKLQKMKEEQYDDGEIERLENEIKNMPPIDPIKRERYRDLLDKLN